MTHTAPPLSTYDVVSSLVNHPALRGATLDVLIDMAQRKIAQQCSMHLSRSDARALITEMLPR